MEGAKKAAAAFAAASILAGSANALTYDELQGLTYLQARRLHGEARTEPETAWHRRQTGPSFSPCRSRARAWPTPAP